MCCQAPPPESGRPALGIQAEAAAGLLPGPCSREDVYAWPRDLFASCVEEEARRFRRHFCSGVVASSEYSGMLSEHEALGRPMEIFMGHGWHLPKHAMRFDHACDIGPGPQYLRFANSLSLAIRYAGQTCCRIRRTRVQRFSSSAVA